MRRLLCSVTVAGLVLLLGGCEWHEHEAGDHGRDSRYEESGRVEGRGRVEDRNEGYRENRKEGSKDEGAYREGDRREGESHDSDEVHHDRD